MNIEQVNFNSPFVDKGGKVSPGFWQRWLLQFQQLVNLTLESLNIGTPADVDAATGIAPFGERLSVEELSTKATGTALAESCIMVQKAANSGAVQAIEGTVAAAQPSGTVNSMSGLTGSARHRSAGDVTIMRGVAADIDIEGTGNGTDAVCFNAAPIGQDSGGTGVFTNGYGLRVGTFGAGFTNKYSLYCNDATAVLHQAGPFVPRFVSGASVTTIAGELVIWHDTGSGNTYLVYDNGSQIKVQLT